jgi:hypothetical protein
MESSLSLPAERIVLTKLSGFGTWRRAKPQPGADPLLSTATFVDVVGEGFVGVKPPQHVAMEAYSSSEDFARSFLGQHSRRRRRQET